MANCGAVVEKLQQDFDEAMEVIQQQDTRLKELTSLPLSLGVVIQVHEKQTLLSVGTMRLVVNTPSSIKIAPGDQVAIHPKTQQIVDNLTIPVGGQVGEVKLVHQNAIELDINGTMYLVHTRGYKNPINIGDRVSVDETFSAIREVIPQTKSSFNLSHEVNLSWDAIGGLTEAKEALKEAVEYPITYRKLYEHYNKKPIKGVLLYGPPGCGKTLLAKALATSLADMSGSKSQNYLYIKGPELLDKFVGTTEQMVRQLFKVARLNSQTTGIRTVIFIDEADAILRRRGSGISSDVESTIVPAFLAEMDGLDSSDTSPLVLLATNRSDSLDPAVVRDGRIDRKIRVTRPTLEAAKDIFQIHLKGIPLHKATTSELAKAASKELYTGREMYEITTTEAQPRKFHFHNLVSGALIAGIVSRAVSGAFRRDMVKGTKSGLSMDDLLVAIEQAFIEHKDVDHREAILDYCDGVNIHSVKRMF